MAPGTIARFAFCLVAAVIFLALAVEAIEKDVLDWMWAGLAILALGVAPWDRLRRGP